MGKKKGGPLSEYKKKKLKDDLRILFNDGSIMRYSIRDLSSKFDIAKNTVQKYLDDVALEVPRKDIQKVTLDLKRYLEEAIEDIRALWEHSKAELNPEEIRKNIDMMFKAIDKFTDFLERFSIKPKAVDNINLHARVEHQLILE